jgi:hypothetical protein
MSRVKALGNGNLDGERKKRKGVHAKSSSKNRGSKKYKKPYNGQGR